MSEILFLAHRAPWPPDRGDRIRSWHLLSHLSDLAPVHVAAFADTDADAAAAFPVIDRMVEGCWIDVRPQSRTTVLAKTLPRLRPLSLGLFDSARMRDHVAHVLATRPITHIVAFSSQMAQFVPRDFAGQFVMDFVDVDSAKFTEYANSDQKFSPLWFAHRYEGWRLAAWERAVAARANHSLFVSEAEAQLFRDRAGSVAHNVHAIENGIDAAHFSPDVRLERPTAPGPLAVFTGQMDYRPNAEAVRWFADMVLPGIREVKPDFRFAIVGRNPTDLVQALAKRPGVIVTGEVADTRPWLAAASVVVAPLKVARGVQNKLLEAMSMGRAVVASSPAARGIDAEVGSDLIVADEPNVVARSILDLVEHPNRAVAMGQAARARMVARYSWQATLAPLAGLMGLESAAG